MEYYVLLAILTAAMIMQVITVYYSMRGDRELRNAVEILWLLENGMDPQILYTAKKNLSIRKSK